MAWRGNNGNNIRREIRGGREWRIEAFIPRPLAISCCAYLPRRRGGGIERRREARSHRRAQWRSMYGVTRSIYCWAPHQRSCARRGDLPGMSLQSFARAASLGENNAVLLPYGLKGSSAASRLTRRHRRIGVRDMASFNIFSSSARRIFGGGEGRRPVRPSSHGPVFNIVISNSASSKVSAPRQGLCAPAAAKSRFGSGEIGVRFTRRVRRLAGISAKKCVIFISSRILQQACIAGSQSMAAIMRRAR